jgi:hypothetical protein
MTDVTARGAQSAVRGGLDGVRVAGAGGGYQPRR